MHLYHIYVCIPSMPAGNSAGASLVLPITLCVAIQTYFSPVRRNWDAAFRMDRASSRVLYKRTILTSDPTIISSWLNVVVFETPTRSVARILNLFFLQQKRNEMESFVPTTASPLCNHYL